MKTIHTFIFIIISLLLQSCGKETDGCPQSTNDFYNLTDAEKSKIPYTGTDTLLFISNQGDTATLIGQGKNQTYNNVTVSLGNPDCGGTNSKNYQKVNYSYLNSKMNKISMLNFSLFVDDVSNPNPFDVYVDFVFNNGVSNYSFISRTNYLNGQVDYSDSIIINSTMIKGIKLSSKQDTGSYIFYNKQFGLLEIKLGEVTLRSL
ncbi:MAG: hypothetical protein V4620_00095 [Bacteroidota bacterium]